VKRKGKEECLYSAILVRTHTQSKRSDMNHTVLPANNTMAALTCFRLKVTLLIACFQCWIRSRQYVMLRNIVRPSAARCPCAVPSPSATLPATSIGLRTETGRNFDRLRRPNGLLSTTKVTDINSVRRDRPCIHIRQGGYVIVVVCLFVC